MLCFMFPLLHETSWIHLHPHFLPALAVVVIAAAGLLGRHIARSRARSK